MHSARKSLEKIINKSSKNINCLSGKKVKKIINLFKKLIIITSTVKKKGMQLRKVKPCHQFYYSRNKKKTWNESNRKGDTKKMCFFFAELYIPDNDVDDLRIIMLL